MKYIALILVSIGFIATTTPTWAQSVCKCRIKGGYVAQGQTACLRTPSGMSLARCVKVLNNTSWETLNQPCPYASVAPDMLNDSKQTPFPSKPVLSTYKS